MEYKNFEEFLSYKCDTHTNNDPAGFERWLEELDGEEYIKYADEYAELQSLKSYDEGYHRGMNGLTK